MQIVARGILLSVFSASVAMQAQTTDAKTLLDEVAKAARETRSWNLEGRVLVQVNGRVAPEISFHYYLKQGGQFANLTTGGLAPLQIVCTDVIVWIAMPQQKQYYSTAKRSSCIPAFGYWEHVAEFVDSAQTRGPQKAAQDGIATCEAVEVQASKVAGFPMNKPEGVIGKFRRVLCIDPARKEIVWDRVEGKAEGPSKTGPNVDMVQITQYTHVERDVEFPASVFKFQPPAGSVLLK